MIMMLMINIIQLLMITRYIPQRSFKIFWSTRSHPFQISFYPPPDRPYRFTFYRTTGLVLKRGGLNVTLDRIRLVQLRTDSTPHIKHP